MLLVLAMDERKRSRSIMGFDPDHSTPCSAQDLSYAQTATLLSSEAFVNSLFQIRHILKFLRKRDDQDLDIGRAFSDFDKRFNGLKGLRDSLAHAEDRRLQKIKGERIETRKERGRAFKFVKSPSPLFVVGSLDGLDLVATDAHGQSAKVRIDREGLRFVRDLAVAIINSYERDSRNELP